jgi:hypothetical protein
VGGPGSFVARAGFDDVLNSLGVGSARWAAGWFAGWKSGEGSVDDGMARDVPLARWGRHV